MTILRFGACLLLLVSSAVNGNAQQAEKELDPVTITSNFSQAHASRTGRNIQVISGERFRHLPVNSIDELLRYIPGIELQARGPMGTQSDIVMRGGTFQQVLVIVDGIRLNDPFSGHFSSYIPIAPAEIDRIEVLKGASSSLYGSEAVGGVIQIVTRTFAARTHKKEKNFQGQAGVGQYGLWTAQAGGYHSDGRTSIAGGLISNNAEGIQQRGIRGYFHNHTASLSAARQFGGGWRLALRSAYDERDFAAQNYYTTFASDTSTERVRTLWNQLNLGWQKGRHYLSFDAGYRNTYDRFRFNTLSAPNQNYSGLWQLLVRDEFRISERLLLNNGIQFNNRSIRSNDRGNHSENQVAVVSTLQYSLPSGFTFVPALRFDWQQRRGFEFVPQLSLSWRRGDWQLRGSAGQTIRDADFTERYNNYQKTVVASGRIGNPELKAERATAYEIGADYSLTSGLRLSGSFFARRHKGLIDYVPTPYIQMPRRDNLIATGTYALARNIAEVNITGAELDINYSWKLRNPGQQLTASSGFTWARARNAGGAAGFYLNSFARYLVNFQASYTSSRFTCGMTGIYKQRAEAQRAPAIKAELSKDYFVLNAKAQFFVLPEKLGVFVQADNLFNREYSDLLGTLMPGRWMQFGAQFKL